MGIDSKLVQWSLYEEINEGDLNNLSKFISDNLISDLLEYVINNGKPMIASNIAVRQDTGSNYQSKIDTFWGIDADGKIMINSSVKTNIHDVPSANPRIDVIEVQRKYIDQNSSTRNIINPTTGVITPTSVYAEFGYDIDVQVNKGSESATPTAPNTSSGWVKIAEVYVDTAGGVANADIYNVSSEVKGVDNIGWTAEKQLTYLLESVITWRRGEKQSNRIVINNIVTDDSDNSDGEFQVKRLDDETGTNRDVSNFSASDTIIMSGASHGIITGDYIQVTGATTLANNGVYKVTNVASATLTIDTDYKAVANVESGGAGVLVGKFVGAKLRWDESDSRWHAEYASDTYTMVLREFEGIFNDMNFPLLRAISGTNMEYDITYTGDNINTITFKRGVTTVATATYSYDGSDNIDYVTLVIGSDSWKKQYTYDGSDNITDVDISKL